jgi:MoaA/NifB/PqqE/SkfB family radical SAM enzyme
MENKKLYCVNAFHNLSINSTGTVKHCCMINGQSKDRVVNIPIKELWKDKWMEEVRESFRDGVRHEACSKCWNEEDAGRDSKRVRDNQKFNFPDDGSIRTLELNMGNTCNIKCRTCHPYSSSQWVKEFYDTIPESEKKPTWTQYLQKTKIYNDSWEQDSRLWADLETIGDKIVLVDFYGGEPWLIKQQWNFIRKCVSMGWAKNMSLHYNTNGTQWNEELISLFENFKFVDVGFSIDGVGDKFEFMRHPAKWNEVYGNMLKAKEWSKTRPNTLFGICHTISSLNVYYIPEFLEFFNDKDWHLYLNLVHYPDHFCAQVFPDAIKKIICDKLEATDKKYEQAWRQLPGIIQFVKDGKYNDYNWKMFKQEVDIHDNYRKENYYETFKEIGLIIKNHHE